VAEPLLENLRAFLGKIAGTLGGTAVERAGLTGFLSSDFDPFLNHLFASGSVTPRDAAEALEGRPGFVWFAQEPVPTDVGVPGADRPKFAAMHLMTATTEAPPEAPQVDGEIVEVRSPADLDAWHEVYCEVFAKDPRSRDDWHRVRAALGSAGDDSLLLLLARMDGSPAATAAVFYEQDVAGLYCFATRERMRGRGLASALVQASHAAARERGIDRALLQATASGRPVYARAGYREERSLPVLLSP
jgi:GNAT superfamily N-acetyltransferase